jgi:hypothetical protein
VWLELVKQCLTNSNRQLPTDDLNGSTTVAKRLLPMGEIQIIQAYTDDQEEI